MEVASFEVYITVYNMNPINNKFKILLKDEQLKSLNVDTQLVMNVDYLYKISYIEKVNNFIVDSFSKSKKLTRKDFDQLKAIIIQIIHDKTTIIIPGMGIENDFFEIELPPGVYELDDMNNTIKQSFSDSDFELKIEADTISMKSVFTTSNNIYFNSELTTLLGFTNTDYSKGTHKSKRPVMITTTNKIHLKCDCVDGPIANSIPEQLIQAHLQVIKL